MMSLPRTLNARLTTALVLGVAALVAATNAWAAPLVDGRFDPNEGYTSGYTVNFSVQNTTSLIGGGTLWTYLNPLNGDVYVSLYQSKTIVDNTYGKTQIGWGNDAATGKDHKFGDLTGSDKAEFVFTNGLGAKVLDVFVDYFSASSGAPSGYKSLGVSGGDGSVVYGSASNVLEAATTMDYNFNTLGFDLTTDSPATDDNYITNVNYPGWIFDYGYELRVSGSMFGAGGYGGVTIPLVHDSPNKIGGNVVYVELDNPIPEPATVLLVGSGLIGALGYFRRCRTS